MGESTALRPKYSRVLLKLGGEMFGGGSVGLDPDVVAQVARQIAEVVRSGVQVAVVIGGGNFFRGAQLQQRGMERTRSDYMGMLGTVMNSLALQDFLEKEGIVERRQYSELPPRVEYALTDKGRDLLPLVVQMRCFGERWLADEAAAVPA